VVRHVVFAVPGALTTPTGGYAYDARMISELRALGWHVDAINLGAEFPRPSAQTRKSAHMQLGALPTSYPIVIDGLAFGALPEIATTLAASHRLIALVHHPLALETGLSLDESQALHKSERAALAGARKVVVTSEATARIVVSDYGVGTDRVAVVRPGSDRVAPAVNKDIDIVSLLAVGAVVPRKGYDLLIAALAQLRHLPWRLTIVGDLTRDIQTAASIKANVARFGLEQRVILTGAVSTERLAKLYAGADVFVLASRFEGYGMAFAEAIAYGLPVVGTEVGAITETVSAEARILVPSEDITALSDALRRLIEDPGLRRRLADGARTAAAELPSWQQSAELFSQALETTL
jgi:glycosyltransferase involved in cell wall biosynthesis